MAYRCVQLCFPPEAEPRQMSGLVEMAQSMTSLRLVVKEGAEGRQSVAFQSHAPRWVDLHSNGPRRVFISSLTAPTLYQLIWMAAERLGAGPPCQLPPLPVPLTAEGLGRAERREARTAALVMASIILTVIAGAAVIVWLVRWLAG